jgi:OOP family OmpA-OmpF porin
MTAEGNCVLTGTDGGGAGCPMGGMGEATNDMYDHEKTVYFDFNKSTLTAHAMHHLDHLAMHLHKDHGHVGEITIVGYADRIGNAAYNEKLAMKRAEAVRDYLVSKGVKAKKMEVRSLGKTVPKADCPADMPRAKMIECLHEDRRVEIEFSTK